MRRYQALVAGPSIVLLLMGVSAAVGALRHPAPPAIWWGVAGFYALTAICGLLATRANAGAILRSSARACVGLMLALSIVGLFAGLDRDQAMFRSGIALLGGGVLTVLSVLIFIGIAGLNGTEAAECGEAGRPVTDRWLLRGFAVILLFAGAGSIVLGAFRLSTKPGAASAAQPLMVITAPPDSSRPLARPTPAKTPAQIARATNTAAAQRPADPKSVRHFHEHGFSLRMPGQPWTEVRPGGLNPLAAVSMMRARPLVFFMVLPERISPADAISTDLFASVVRANLFSAASDARQRSDRPLTVGGIEGRRITFDATVERMNLRYVIWIGIRDDRAFQLVVWGPASATTEVERNADQAFTWFETPERPPVGTLAAGALQEAPEYGLRLDLTGTDWMGWASLPSEVPDAAIGMVRGRDAAVAVIPVRLHGLDPDPEDLASGLLARVNFEYPGGDVRRVDAPGDSDSRQTYRTTSVFNGRLFEFRLRIERAGDAAVLVAGREAADSPGTPTLDEIVDRVSFDPPGGDAPAPESLDAAARARHAAVLNDTGLAAYAAGRYDDASRAFERAVPFAPGDAVILANALRAMETSGNDAGALDLLRPALDRFKGHRDIRSAYARLLDHTGDLDGARAEYGALFEGGLRDSEMLVRYVELLIEADELDAADRAVTRYGGRSASRALRARVMAARGDRQGATALLRQGMDARPFDAACALTLLDLALEADDHEEVVRTCDRLIAAGEDGGGAIHALRGDALAALDRLPEAKASYDAAVAQDPTNEVLRARLRTIATLMGESDTSTIRTPIEAVQLPPGVLADLPECEHPPTNGAVFDYTATVVRFVPGRTHRETRYIRAQAVDRAGVEMLGTFRFTFDPTHERMFVNRLEVFDETGLVATGQLSQYYVMDEADATVASQERVLHIPVQGLAPGRIVELVVTRESLGAPEDLPFIDHSFISHSPVGRGVLVVMSDPDLVRHRARAGVEVRRVDGGIVFSCDNQPAWQWEPLGPDPRSYMPGVSVFAAGDTWEREARDYMKRLAARMAPDDGIEALAARLTAGCATAEEKAAAIARHVQSEYTYRAIAFGPRASIPSAAMQIVRDRSGDCKDHSLLAHVLMRAAGVPSSLALVSSSGWIDPGAPSLHQFDHMIVYVADAAGGPGRFIDLTDKDADVGARTVPALGSATALVLDPARPRLVEIPRPGPDSCRVECSRTVRADGHAIIVRETVRGTGDGAAVLRGMLATDGPSRISEAVRGVLSSVEPTVQIVSARARGLEDTGAPIELEVEYRLPGRVQRIGGTRIVTPPCTWERILAVADPVEGRSTPFRYLHALHLTSETVIAGGGGTLPSGARARAPGCTASCAAERAGDGVRVRTEVRRQSGAYKSGDYAAHAALGADLVAAAQSPVELGDETAQADDR